MGLKQNTSILAQLPLRHMGGSPANLRPFWGRTDLRNSTVGQGIETDLAGIPAGHYHPSSWNLPYIGGQMSAFTYTGATFTAGPLTMAAGRNAVGDSTFTFTVGPSQLELVVSASGTSAITFTLTGGAAAVLQAVGSIAVQFTVGPSTLGAISGIFASQTITWSGSATPRGDGNMIGAVSPFTELSPENLAAAVWNALATEYNSAGTMGNKLNLASSGGIDYNTLAQAVWTYVTRELTITGNEAAADAVRAEIAAELARIDVAVSTRLASSGYTPAPTASDNATAVLLAAEVAPIKADIRKVNNYTVSGEGTASDPWGPA